MKRRAAFFLLSTVVGGFMLISGSCFAQQKPDENDKTTKTVTIHITKVVDGNTVVIGTTILTDGDFDADAFLEENGMMNNKPEGNIGVERDIVSRHPESGELSEEETDDNSPDTNLINDDRVIVINDKFDLSFPPPPSQGMPFEYNFDMPYEFSNMEGTQFEEMLEGLARSLGPENVMPLGEMKQVVVKKKRNGKKVIITFEDWDENGDEHGQGNQKEEKVIIYKNGDQSSAPQKEEHVIVKGDQDEKVMINEDVDKTTPVKREKKVIIIKEERSK